MGGLVVSTAHSLFSFSSSLPGVGATCRCITKMEYFLIIVSAPKCLYWLDFSVTKTEYFLIKTSFTSLHLEKYEVLYVETSSR